MPALRGFPLFLGPLVLLVAAGSSRAQQPMGHEDDFEVPPLLKSRPESERARDYPSVARESDRPWGLPPEILEALRERAAVHREYALRFTCDETVLLAKYDDGGEVSKEKERRLAYFLVRNREDGSLAEERRKLASDGSIRPGAEGSFRDDTRFPPPYDWLFLFGPENEPFMSFRHLGERQEGFEFVHEIQFRGALPYTDGRDVREWEGTILVDAVRWTPLSLVAEPRGQKERVQEVFRRYVQALKISIFGIINFRTRPKPTGFYLDVAFDFLHEELRFPTRIRYDTFQAIGYDEVLPARASIRRYDNYRFTQVDTEERLGDRLPRTRP